LVRHRPLASGTAQRPIGLEGKVLSRETASFPGQGYGSFPVPLNRSLRGGLLVRRWESGSELSRAHRLRMELMAQFQTQIPHPLADQLPDLLTRGRMADPSVGILFLVFISQFRFKGPPIPVPRHSAGVSA